MSPAGTESGALRDDRGMTLVELLVAIALSMVIAAAALTFMVVSIDQQNAISSRTRAASQAEAGLAQLLHDLRQAMAQDGAGNALSVTVSISVAAKTTSIALDIPTPGSDTTPQTLSWTCPSTASATSNAGSCTRTLGSGQAQTKISGVQSVSFAPLSAAGTLLALPATNPAYVAVTLKAQVISQLDHGTPATKIVSGISNPILLKGGADLRNFA